MKIIIKHVGLRADAELDAAIEKHLFAVADQVAIDTANVVVERRWDGGAAFRVAVHIETPGPDVKAEGADQTLNAAVLKFGRHLKEQVKSRSARRVGRVKTNLQAPPLDRQGVRR
jgi:hypothetical protein